jgi:hypothetical protein
LTPGVENRSEEKEDTDMKRLILILGMFITTIALYGVTAQAETFAAAKVIEVPGATEKQVMEKVNTWAGSYAQASRVDAKTGIITIKGESTYPSPPLDRIQYTIAFELKNTIQGNKDTVTFENVMLKSPTTYLPDSSEEIPGQATPVIADRDRSAVTSRLTYVTENLEAYLLGKSTESCPLVKCPDCSVVSPSSEEMKEHMKVHPEHGTAPVK